MNQLSDNRYQISRAAAVLLTVICLLFSVPQAFAAVLYAGSATQVVYEGQTFVVDWYMDTEGASINTLDLKLDFSKDTLRAVETTAGNSLISLWVELPSFNNSIGRIEMSGGVPNGFNGSSLPIFRATFQAIKTGNASISLNTESVILKNDGTGNAETLKFRPIEFPVVDQNLQPIVITSSSHPDQNRWYQAKDVRISFNPKEGTDYSLSFSSNAEILPDDVIDEIDGRFEVSSLPDGVYYFKLNSKIGTSPWQEAAVYRVQIDGTSPESFTPLMGEDQGRKFISFSTVDKTSGISHYNIKSGLLGFWKETSSPWELKKPLVGKHIKIEAVDNAGNKRVETIEYKGLIPVWVFITLVAIILAVLSRIVYKKKKEMK